MVKCLKVFIGLVICAGMRLVPGIPFAILLVLVSKKRSIWFNKNDVFLRKNIPKTYI